MVGGSGGRCAAGHRGTATDGVTTAEMPLDPAEAARASCLRLLTVQSRTRMELAAALQRKAIPNDVIEATLDRLDDAGLVDDTAFAEMAVRSGRTHRGLGARALRAELRRRGVPDGIADAAIATVNPGDEEERARELVRHRLRTTTVRDETAAARRLVNMLGRRGYPEELAFRVVREEVRAAGIGADAGIPGTDLD